jgi:hypothetical protein
VCEKDSASSGASAVVRNLVEDGKYVLDRKTKTLITERIPEEDLAVCYDKDTNTFTCQSMRDTVLNVMQGVTINPYTNNPYPLDFVERIKKRFRLPLALGQVPLGSPEGINKIVVNVPLPPDPVTSPSPIKPKSIVKSIPKPKPVPRPKRKRHVIPSKKQPETITRMLLLGAVERIALFDKTFTFNIVTDDDDDGVTEEEVAITYDSGASRINVAVVTFYADLPSSIDDLKDQLKLVPARVQNIYVAGLDAKGISEKDRTLFKSRIGKLSKKIKGVFYTDEHEDRDILDVLIDVTVDMEGVVPVD